MTTAKKKRLLLISLTVLAIWPAVHHLLVVSFDMNPWKLFGWSMYCAPRRWVNVDIVARDRSGQSRLDADKAGAGFPEFLDDYANQRWVYGQALPPDRVAKRIFNAYPDFLGLTITIHQLSYDRASGYYRNQPSSYEYAAPSRN